MGVGLEVWNDAGVPQTIDLSFNLVLIEKGTVSVGSNTGATGTGGVKTLPTKTEPYLVFIKTAGNACVLVHGTASFTWFMAQSTTSFEYWAYNRSDNTGNVGMQVWNADGSLRWSLTQRPLIITSLTNSGGTTVPYSGENPGGNVIATPPTFTIPSGHAVAYSDPGYLIDLYTGVPGYTLCPNMKFWPCVSVSGTTLTMQWCRRYANRGTLPGGVNYNTYTGKAPSFIVTAAAV